MSILVAPEGLRSMNAAASALHDDAANDCGRGADGSQLAPCDVNHPATPVALRSGKISWQDILVKCIMFSVGISYLDRAHGPGSNPHLRDNCARTQLQPGQRDAAPLAAGHQPP